MKRTVQSSLKRLCAQLQIAFETLHSKHLSELERNCWINILDEHVAPEGGFQYFCRVAHEFIPSFGNLAIIEIPYTNVLAFDKDRNNLYFRGANGGYYHNDPIPITSSITGLLFAKDANPIIDVDPRLNKYKDKFLQYNSKDLIPTREVAINLADRDDNLRGVLNFEFYSDVRITKTHVAFLLAARRRLSLIFTALEARRTNAIGGARGEAATMQAYLGNIASAFGHEIFAYTSGISGLLNSIKGETSIDHIKTTLDDIGAAHDVQKDFILEFTRKLSTIAELRIISLEELINWTANLFVSAKHIEMGKLPFGINVNVPEEVLVLASGLLEIYLSSIFENSRRQFIRKREKHPKFVGSIDVGHRGYAVNNRVFSVEYEVIEIVDNGTGVSAGQLAALREGKTGVRFRDDPGLGYALAGARRYMAELGGFLELDSVENASFTVRLGFRKQHLSLAPQGNSGRLS